MATFMTFVGAGMLALTIREMYHYFHEVSE